jgi:PAS domain S-box-containing protein
MQDELARQRSVEEELRSTKEELEIILTNIDDGIVVQDVTAKVVYVNQAAARITGYGTVEEMLKAPPLDYLQELKTPVTSLIGFTQIMLKRFQKK